MDHVTTEDISWMSATHISEQVRRQELSPPVDIATSMTDRIKAVNPQLNAYVTFDEEQVTTDAERLQTQVDSGAALGPLHGVPFAVKELTAMSGLPATYGYLPLKGTVAQHDAAVVKRLKAAGGVVSRKNEYARGWLLRGGTDNHLYGPTHNPWKSGYSAGGSSGGSAAAVAAGLAPIAEGGSDGAGGSVRIPASMCGVVGMKPTHGLIPQTILGGSLLYLDLSWADCPDSG